MMENGAYPIKFSVLIPVYNVEKYLCECVESVLAQTYPAYEIILVDDGSTDQSGLLCDQYALKHPFIKVFHKSNGGLLSTRRYAIEKATGNFYISLDSDDSIKPSALQTVYETIVKHDCDCVIYEFERHQNGKTIESGFDLSQPDRVITDKRELYRTFFLNDRYNSMCRKAVKASVFTGMDYKPFYHVSRGEDMLQSLEILEHCKKAVIIPQPLYNYRMNEASITHTIRYDNYRNDYTLEEQVLLFLQRTDVLTQADMDEVRDYWIMCYASEIRRVALFEASLSQKKAIFEKMKATEYYKSFLADGITDPAAVGYKRIYFKLFCNGNYRLIVLCGKVEALLRKVRGR